MAKLRELAVLLIRDLFVAHDANPQYQSQSSREHIAMLYMPLLSIVMDNVANLYHGSEGKDDWGSSLEKLVIILEIFGYHIITKYFIFIKKSLA